MAGQPWQPLLFAPNDVRVYIKLRDGGEQIAIFDQNAYKGKGMWFDLKNRALPKENILGWRWAPAALIAGERPTATTLQLTQWASVEG